MKQKQKIVFVISASVVCAASAVAVLAKLYYHNRTPRISFSDWIAVKSIQPDNDTLRFAVASMVSAEETWVTYKELVGYVAAAIGDKVSMILRPSYSDVRTLLEENKVDLALVCTGTYIACLQTGKVELLVVPDFEEGIEYRCLFIVRVDSGIKSISDLHGKSFAFTDAESHTGCAVPSWVISEQGFEPESYFSKTIYTSSHDRSIHAVVNGIVDGASVDSLVFHSFAKTHPELTKQLQVIWRSEVFGAPPILVPATLPEKTKERLAATFLTMSQNAQGREILADLDIEHFRKAKPDEYNSARAIWKAIGHQE